MCRGLKLSYASAVQRLSWLLRDDLTPICPSPCFAANFSISPFWLAASWVKQTAFLDLSGASSWLLFSLAPPARCDAMPPPGPPACVLPAGLTTCCCLLSSLALVAASVCVQIGSRGQTRLYISAPVSPRGIFGSKFLLKLCLPAFIV